MGMIDATVIRAHNMLLENAEPERISGEIVQAGIIQDSQRAGREYRRFLENGAKLELVLPGHHIIDCRQASMPAEWKKTGWQIERHRNMGLQVFDQAALQLFLADEQKRGAVRGDKLRKLVEGEPILPDAYLDFYLAHTELIPESWKGKAVFFWGTIYRSPGGDFYVRDLVWLGGRWNWSYRWLDDGWGSTRPALVLASN